MGRHHGKHDKPRNAGGTALSVDIELDFFDELYGAENEKFEQKIVEHFSSEVQSLTKEFNTHL